jgi:hypothetical protein
MPNKPQICRLKAGKNAISRAALPFDMPKIRNFTPKTLILEHKTLPPGSFIQNQIDLTKI